MFSIYISIKLLYLFAHYFGVMFGMRTLKNYVHYKQSMITIHPYLKRWCDMIVVMFGDCILSEMWCDYCYVWLIAFHLKCYCCYIWLIASHLKCDCCYVWLIASHLKCYVIFKMLSTLSNLPNAHLPQNKCTSHRRCKCKYNVPNAPSKHNLGVLGLLYL